LSFTPRGGGMRLRRRVGRASSRLLVSRVQGTSPQWAVASFLDRGHTGSGVGLRWGGFVRNHPALVRCGPSPWAGLSAVVGRGRAPGGSGPKMFSAPVRLRGGVASPPWLPGRRPRWERWFPPPGGSAAGFSVGSNGARAANLSGISSGGLGVDAGRPTLSARCAVCRGRH
jgi:hypothetical protein